ncbi:hypothetical protein [Arthrobacter cupressi]|uniref:Methylenetetrahydrofolate reductase (NADPH) n=1 Tax=Arthrobacter cupressi TaxID=1045773 RepID=A0A1G8STL1_9MICC|nr:hypothetical protein [Arthrobacter cupressi]NYD78404.1 methylenetetrahydrofolate reductase (NADPH) [Arthrobacter cupressi]SDJ32569.1 methylenetetrahydrofolate reductase (NADPH) [Arthrobacter cupressi]
MENLRFKIAPSLDAEDFVKRWLPSGAELTVSCLPGLGVGRTLATAASLSQQGHHVIPHLPARMIPSTAFLRKALKWLARADIGRVLVMAGDGPQDGPYGESLPLMEDIAQFTSGEFRLGVLGHPEPHPYAREQVLYHALIAKQHLASELTTQLCFDPNIVNRYLRRLRSDGVELPVWISAPTGLPQADIGIATATLGLGPSVRRITRPGPLGRQFFKTGNFDLDIFEKQLTTDVAGFHINTFNRPPGTNPTPEPQRLGATP